MQSIECPLKKKLISAHEARVLWQIPWQILFFRRIFSPVTSLLLWLHRSRHRIYSVTALSFATATRARLVKNEKKKFTGEWHPGPSSFQLEYLLNNRAYLYEDTYKLAAPRKAFYLATFFSNMTNAVCAKTRVGHACICPRMVTAHWQLASQFWSHSPPPKVRFSAAKK